MKTHPTATAVSRRLGLAACAALGLGLPASGQAPDAGPGITATERPAVDETADLRRQLQTLEAAMAAREREMTELQAALEEALAQADRWRKGAIELDRRYKAALEAEEAAQAEARRRQTALEQAAGEAEQMRQELEMLAKDVEARAALADAARREAAALREQLARQAAAAPVAADPEPEPDAAGTPGGLLAAAHDLLDEGRADEAAALFRQGAARWPDDLAFPVGLASCHYGAGRLPMARELLEEILDRDDDLPGAQGLLGLVLWAQDELRPAERHLARAVRGQPENAQWQVYLGMVQYARGREADARKSFEGAIEADPANPEAHFNLAVLLAGGNRPDLPRARIHYQESVRLGGAAHPDLAQRLELR